ncbi:hypothetical protein [Paragemmobacter ruber]|uniref:Uncharacterized protein n=1 Tax=Paragemmobacter ruber TaxID=1985673 RepID=A0ABW9Y0E7_9RHOB|nr:hypothetical protein [Rhodobacter ruber]NBE05963.1 hypothetical protein [Rhodobacter ruber]
MADTSHDAMMVAHFGDTRDPAPVPLGIGIDLAPAPDLTARQTIRFQPSDYAGGRILLMCGQVQAGAVFPPASSNPGKHPWAWRFWLGGQPTLEGRASTEQAAKNALLSTFRDFLYRSAFLVQVPR